MPQPTIQLTNCDWLSFSVLMTPTERERLEGFTLTQPHGYILREYGNTNIYAHRAILHTPDGEKVLTLLWQPYSKVLHPDSLFVEVANKLLYYDYSHVLELLKQIHPYQWQSLSRFDICTDFQPTAHQLQTISWLSSGKAYVQGKREGSQFHDYKQGQQVDKVPRCMSWGSPYTAVKFKLYNKTKEIFELDANGRRWCNKPYIAAAWRQAGINDQFDVWRLEASITGASSFQWYGARLDWDTTRPEIYMPLYYDLVQSRFVIRKNEGHTNKRYDKIIPFLEIPADGLERLRKMPPTGERHIHELAGTIRALVKELDKPEVQASRATALPLLATLGTIIDASKLNGYFARVMDKPFDQWKTDYINALP